MYAVSAGAENVKLNYTSTVHQSNGMRELNLDEIQHISVGNPFILIAGIAAGAVVGEFAVGFADGMIKAFQE